MTLRHHTSRAAGQAGFALVETLISATILITVALATLAAVDRAQRTSLESTSRSVAASLAEQDQERMRSLRATELSNYHPAPRPVSDGNGSYTVTSRVEWVRDATGGTQSCTNDSTQADYLRLTSTVTSAIVGNTTRPVSMSSLVAAPLGTFGAKQGTLAVKITDGHNRPVAGLPVSITGTAGMSDTTNSAGCAIFAFITAGTYHVLLNQAGWVDPSGATPVDATKIVNAGSVSLLPLQYDRAGKITVKFDTLVGGTPSPSRGWAATAANSNVPGSQRRSMFAVNAPQPSVELPNLFPFDTGYGTYSGECNGANPVSAIPDASWFTGNGAGNLVVLAPGDTTPVVTVRQPPLKLTVKNGSSNFPGANVVLTPKDNVCTVKPILSTDASGRATKGSYDFGGSTGTVDYDPGVPFGKYDLCVDGLVNGTRHRYVAPIDVNDRAGITLPDVRLDLAPNGVQCQ